MTATLTATNAQPSLASRLRDWKTKPRYRDGYGRLTDDEARKRIWEHAHDYQRQTDHVMDLERQLVAGELGDPTYLTFQRKILALKVPITLDATGWPANDEWLA